MPANTTSPAAAIRRASTVRVQSGRNDVEKRRKNVGFSDISPTSQRYARRSADIAQSVIPCG